MIKLNVEDYSKYKRYVYMFKIIKSLLEPTRPQC